MRLAIRSALLLLPALLLFFAPAASPQEHQHDHQHDAGAPGEPPKPQRVVEIGPGGIPLATPEGGVDVEVKIYDLQTQHLDRPLKLVEFEAPAIGRITKYLVLLPENYETSGKAYPVLYMLHGFSQNYTVWPIMGLGQHVGAKDLIVVMPDGGNSWFINWAESTDGQINNWEDFIVYDLIHSVDQTFRTVPAREGRAISGLSMGGYGALMIGLRHPGLFCSVASQSGALDFARSARARLEGGAAPQPNEIPAPRDDDRDSNVPELIRIPGFTMQHERYPHGIAFKTVDETKQYDPFELIGQVPMKYLPHLYLDCGIDDGLLSPNQEFAAILMTNKIPFAYGQTPGGHGANYWSRELATSIAVQYAVLERNVKAWLIRSAAEQMEQAQSGVAPDDAPLVTAPDAPNAPASAPEPKSPQF